MSDSGQLPQNAGTPPVGNPAHSPGPESASAREQKMEIAARLAAGTAHDLNNILIVIRGYAEVLQGALGHAPTLLDQVRKIATAAERASQFATQLGLFGRSQMAAPKPVDANLVVCRAVPFFYSLLFRGVTLRVHLGADLPTVRADQTMINHALAALVEAAVAAAPDGGGVWIETSQLDITPESVALHPEGYAGQIVRFSVRDSGMALDETSFTRLFDPFFSSKELGRGSGLGLAVVHGIARQHRGWVEASSHSEGGTEVALFLPVTAEGETGKPLGIKTTTPRGGTEAVLVVSADPVLISLVNSILREFGYRTVNAATESEALAQWEKRGGRFDLLIADIKPPASAMGFQLMNKFSASNFSLKTLLICGQSFDLTPSVNTIPPGFAILPQARVAVSLARSVRTLLDRRSTASAGAQLSP